MCNENKEKKQTLYLTCKNVQIKEVREAKQLLVLGATQLRDTWTEFRLHKATRMWV